MPWGSILNSEILAIHAALVPTNDGSGEIIYFGGDQHWDQNNIGHETTPSKVDASRRFTCRPDGSGNHAITYVKSPTTDVFCCGHALMADGRLMVCGGTQKFPPGAVGGGHGHGEAGHFPGHRNCWVYDPHTHVFSEVAPLNPEVGRTPGDRPGARTDDVPGGGRWYPSLVTLPSGELFIYAGHPRNDDNRHNPAVPERYRPISNSWVLLPPTAGASAGGPDLYPRLFLLKNGQVFCASRLQGYGNCIQFDAYTGTVTQPAGLPDGHYHGFGASAVLLPLLPNDNYRPRILVCGGVNAQRINLEPTSGTPAWGPAGVRHGSAVNKERIHTCAVILPTGQVLMTGGVRNPTDSNPEVGVNEPEIYTPAIDWATQVYRDIANPADASDRWDTIEEPSSVARNYHSTALLLPDGRVWTAGSNIRGQMGNPATQGQLKICIFTPPYPAGTRPRITSAPSVIAYGQQFDIDVSVPATDIVRIALIRCGSVTHAFDSDQRYVGVSFTRLAGSRLQLTAPPTGAIAPPGAYMLFVIDNSGRPSDYARFLRVGGELYAFTERSIISQDEVQMLATTAPPATVTESFYVVFDGYRQSDLNLPTGPTVTFRWADNGVVVPGLTATIENVLNESSAIGVAQRITLAYNLRFSNTTAFTQLGAPNQRNMRVDVTLGQLATSLILQLYRNAVPYMRDGTTPWLSIDLRVIRRKPGDFLAGEDQRTAATVGDAAREFLSRVLTAFNTRPNNSNHPFLTQLEPSDGSAGRLSLGSHDAGQPVFNYAFAKVRFTAPATITSGDIRMLFRLFNTTTPSTAYNPFTLYRRTGNGPAAIPEFANYNADPVHSPCFAAARDVSTHLAATDPLNVKNITGIGVDEKVVYFGCWLDFNHDSFIRNRMRGDHPCLIAEAHLASVIIPFGATPSDHSLLAQRNIAFVPSDNPGTAAAHTVQHTFELHPIGGKPRGDDPSMLMLAAAAGVPGGGDNPIDDITLASQINQRTRTDELLFRWYDLPVDSIVSLYLPDVDIDALIDVAAQRSGPALYERVDEHTLRLRVLGDVSYLPLPPGRVIPIPGLLSVQLPIGVRAHRRYRVTVHHVSGIMRRVLGAFELSIPVSFGSVLLLDERRRLAVLREIQRGLDINSRWVSIFERYLKQVSDRVRDFGGNPDLIPASPYGAPEDRPEGKDDPIPHPEGCGESFTGRITRVLFDCHGVFEGFVVDSCGCTRVYSTCDQDLAELVLRACRDKLTVAIYTTKGNPQKVERIHIVCC